jgi:hypothetical protein
VWHEDQPEFSLLDGARERATRLLNDQNKFAVRVLKVEHYDARRK